jgi:hypothetical protein
LSTNVAGQAAIGRHRQVSSGRKTPAKSDLRTTSRHPPTRRRHNWPL